MLSPRQSSTSGLIRGLVQSWTSDLKAWSTRIAIRYATAIVLLLAAAAGLVAAIGVGIAALFHWIESVYGSYPAYAAVGCLLLCLTIVSAVVAVVLLRLSTPPMPRPRRPETRDIGRSIAADAMRTTSVPRRMLLQADPATEVMIGLAVACLAGWLVSSRLGQSRNWAKAK